MMAANNTYGGTILIVDDDVTSLQFMCNALENADFTVLVATSGRFAMECLAHIVPDLILMDANMPGMDGLEATVLIKGNARLSHIPVIFMTGMTASEHLVAAFRIGGADYVRKPVRIDELLARIRTHLANGRMVQASSVGLDATGRLMMAIDLDGRFLWCTPMVEATIRRMAPGWKTSEATLPVFFDPVVQRLLSIRSIAGACVDLKHEQFTVELTVIAQYRENEVLVRFNEVDASADIETLLRSFSLTQREAEVLLWVSYGKPNRVIGDILNISPRTVHKHMERIFDKLGIETRSAAAAIAAKSIAQ